MSNMLKLEKMRLLIHSTQERSCLADLEAARRQMHRKQMLHVRLYDSCASCEISIKNTVSMRTPHLERLEPLTEEPMFETGGRPKPGPCAATAPTHRENHSSTGAV